MHFCGAQKNYKKNKLIIMKISKVLFATIIAGTLLSYKKENTIKPQQTANSTMKPHASHC